MTAPTPLKITGIIPGDQSLTVAFTVADSGGKPVTEYNFSLDTGTIWRAFDSTSKASPVTIAGLKNGTSYAVQLRAVTTVGPGVPSEPVVSIPGKVPGVPAIISVTGKMDALDVVFTPPQDNGGYAISRYEYSIDEGQHWQSTGSGVASSFEISALSWQVEYSVLTRAVNALGAGPASNPKSGTPLGLPAPPAIRSVTNVDGGAVVLFDAPPHSGGAPISAYEYSVDSGATWSASTINPSATSMALADLRNGDTYSVGMRVVTPSGRSGMSNIVAVRPFVVSPSIDTLRSARKPGITHYIPQLLDAVDPVFEQDLVRALQRYRALKGRDATTLFEKVQAAADYVSNMAKHPHRHNLAQEFSDPRTWEYQDFPVKLEILSQENQVWDGVEWVPAPGKPSSDAPAVECAFQDFILGGIVNALGAQWMLLGITHHDAFTYYDYELGKWVYIESSYNEHYRAAGTSEDSYVPLSPFELREMNLAGDNSAIAVRHPYQPQRTDVLEQLQPYLQTYPLGFRGMMADINGISSGERFQLGKHLRVIPGGTSEDDYRDLIAGGWELADPDEDIWAPQGETFLESLLNSARGNVVRLSTNLAALSVIFERSVNGGVWAAVDAESELNGFVGEVRFRARSGKFVAGEAIVVQAAK